MVRQNYQYLDFWHTFRLTGILSASLAYLYIKTLNKDVVMVRQNYQYLDFWHTFRLTGILFRLIGIKLPPHWHKTSASLAYKTCFLSLKIHSIYKNEYYIITATKANSLYLGYLHTFRLVYIPYNYNNKTIYKNNVWMPKLCLI